MKYSEIIDNIKTKDYPEKEKIQNNVFELYRKRQKRSINIFLIVILSIILICSAGFLIVRTVSFGTASDLPSSLENISPIASVKPTSFSGNNITTDTDLKVVTTKSLKKSEFEKVFEIQPKVGYTLLKTSGNTFTVKFDTPLKPDTVYKINSVSENKTIYSWAFQTVTDFEIKSHYPDNGYIDPADSVYVDFTHSDTENFIENFSIYPSVSGTFEQYGDRWFFIPSSEFEKDILYTVTIGKDVCRKNGESLEENYEFSFTVPNESKDEKSKVLHPSSDMIDTFSKNSFPSATLSLIKNDSKTAEVTVYKIPSPEEFISVHRKHAGTDYISVSLGTELKRYDKLYSFTSEIETISGKSYIYYPQKAVSGQFIAEITVGDEKLYQFYQVTDLAVYSVFSSSDLTVWVNNCTTSLPESEVEVLLNGSNEKATDKNGIVSYSDVVFDNNLSYLTVKTKNSDSFVLRFDSSADTNSVIKPTDYTVQIDTDCSIYRQGDTVKLFGFAVSESNQIKDFSEIIVSYSWTSDYDSVGLKEDGTFEYKFTLPDLIDEGKHKVTVSHKDNVLAQKEFEVKDYSEGAYSVQIVTEKDFYYENEQINYVISVSDSKGKPVENLEIITPEETTVTTDRYGIAKYPAIATDDGSGIFCRSFRLPSSVTYSHKVKVYKSNLSVKTEQSDGEITVSVSDSVSGKPLDTFLDVEFHCVTLEKSIQKGDYNPGTKTYEEKTVFSETDKIISTDKIATTDGKGSFKTAPATEQNAVYYYKITAAGKTYEPASSVCYITDSFNYSKDYSFVFSAEKESYKVLDSVKLSLFKDGEKVTLNNPVLLTFVGSDGIVNNLYHQTAESINFECIKELCGTTEVYGAYFDGTQIQTIEPVSLNVTDEKFNIEISTDKEEYLPGDTVTLDIRTFENSNMPVSAYLNISVVDDALEESSNSTYDSKTFVYESSYTSVQSNDDKENTANTSDSVPCFAESPLCTSVKTDAEGKATVYFVLPEDQKTWTVSVCGISESGASESAKTEIRAYQDFYIDTEIPDEMDPETDCEVIFGFRTKNTVYKECVYSVTLFKGTTPVETYNATTKANTNITRNFGICLPGEYKVRISVKCGTFYKAEDFYFTVKTPESKESASVTQVLDSEFTLDATEYSSNIALTVFDEDYEFIYTIAKSLENSNAQNISSTLATEFFGSEELSSTQIEKIRQSAPTDTKSFSVYATVFGDYLNKNEMKTAFENVVYKSTDNLNKICSYMGLASIGEPILDELWIFEISELTLEEKLYLALAYAYSGDYSGAYKIYNESIADKIRAAGGVARIEFDGSAEEAEYMTALTAQLCSKISVPYAKELVKNLINSQTAIENYSHQMLVFIKDFIPELSGYNKIDIRFDNGKKQKIVYPVFKNVRVIIPRYDCKTITFTAKKGISVLLMKGE